MSAEDRPDANGGTGALELYRSVHAVTVGAGQRAEAVPGGRFGQRIRAGHAEAEGEVGMDVQVGEHLLKKRKRENKSVSGKRDDVRRPYKTDYCSPLTLLS